jgi:CelD/BcsL family acetyltransferase involved in cellulose biosynthesis
MGLTVLSVAYPLAPVSVDTVGGAEQVLAHIDRSLVRRGHRSLVVGCEESRVSGELLRTPRFIGRIDGETRRAAHACTRAAIDAALRRYRVDVLHMHGIDFHEYLPDSPVPVLATLHLPPEWYPPSVFEHTPPHTYLQCVSQSQQSRCPHTPALIDPIENGVDLDVYRPRYRKFNYVLVLGRICLEKGIHDAIDAARRAGVPLLIAGRVYPYPDHETYFNERVEPCIDGINVRYAGPVGLARKRRLIAGARAVLIPSAAFETSSLVAMEAAACGTPVVAFASGALEEIVLDGETGFMVRDAGAMAEAIGESPSIAPRRCRDYAESHFDLRKTVDAYVRTYQAITRVPHVVRTELEVISGGLDACEADWAGLFERCPGAPPFLHPGWQLNWWRTFGGAELHTLALRSGGHLRAIAPMYVYRDHLVFVGNGISDRLDVLAEDPIAERQLIEAIEQSNYGLDLQELAATSRLLRLPHEQCSVSPVVDLGVPLSKKLRKNLRLQRRYLEEDAGPATIERASAEAMRQLFRLHSSRWSTRGPTGGVLSDPALERFHCCAAAALDRAGLLRLYLLRAGGRVAGALYGFVRGRTFFCYLGGFDPSLARYGPGSLLIEYAMASGSAEGLHQFDFLRGSEPYKYRWGAVDRPQYAIRTR